MNPPTYNIMFYDFVFVVESKYRHTKMRVAIYNVEKII